GGGERMDGRRLGAVGREGGLHAAGHLRGAGVRRPAVRRPHGPTGAPGFRSGARGSRGHSRGEPMDHHSPGHHAGPDTSLAHRVCAGLCACRRRVRLRHLHRRESPQRVGDRAASDRHSARGIPLRRRDRDRRCDVGGFVHRAVRDQRAAALVGATRRRATMSLDSAPAPRLDACADPRATRWIIIAVTVSVLGIFVVLPLINVFVQAFSKGWQAYGAALATADALAAIRLTLLVAAISIVLNLVFGIIAAWAITKYSFPGKSLLTTVIDLPFAVSPVIAGLVFVLLFGQQGYLGPWLEQYNIRIVFALPGIALATVFVTFPFVARELIPLMREQGTQDEEAALSLGASGLRIFFRVTLPNVK